MAYALFGLSEVARCEADYARAAALLDEAAEVVRAREDSWLTAYYLSAQGYVALQTGDPARAAQLQHQSLRLRQEIADQLGISISLDGLGAALIAQGKPVQAARLFGAAQEVRRRMGAAPYLPRRLEREHALASTRAALGEPAFEAAWAEGQALSVEEVLSDPSTAEPHVREMLTPREREVAALVARGLTNRQIAEHLVISARTAEGHVERLRDKLACSSRAQVAVWATRHGLT
jgi:DNA-binding CsgD family transcriptional regulator